MREVVVGGVDRKAEQVGVGHQPLLPEPHGFAPPAGHGVFVDGLALVGDDQVLVDADYLAIPFAARARSERVIEAEQVLGGRLEKDAVRLEAGGKFSVGRLADDPQHPVADGESPGDRIPDAGLEILVPGDAGPVDDHIQLSGRGVGAHAGNELLDEHRFAVYIEALQSVPEQLQQAVDHPLSRSRGEGRRERHARTLAEREHVFGDVIHAEVAYLRAADGRIGASDAREQQLEVIVQFGGRADGRTGIARIDLLFDGDGRSDARDQVHVGFGDLAQELPGIGREALDIASLSLGEDRVESQRRFARARKTGDDREGIVRDFDLDVAEVVHPRPPDMDGLFCHVALFHSFGLSA